MRCTELQSPVAVIFKYWETLIYPFLDGKWDEPAHCTLTSAYCDCEYATISNAHALIRHIWLLHTIAFLFYLHRAFTTPLWLLGRICFFFFGFQWVKVKGRRATLDKAPIIIIGPHSSFFDVLAAFVCGLPSGVSRIENLGWTLFGSMSL